MRAYRTATSINLDPNKKKYFKIFLDKWFHFRYNIFISKKDKSPTFRKLVSFLCVSATYQE